MAKQSNPKSPVVAIITDLIFIKPLNEVVTNSGLEKSKAEKYALGYAPLMREVVDQSDLLKPLDKTKPEDAAKAKRISLDLGKICSRLTVKKKEDKDTLLIETRLIDGLFNVAESTARLTQKEADAIVDYLANIEKERLDVLADMRRAELEKYEADTTYLPLDIMGDDQYARCLESAQLAFEARLDQARMLEAERIENERVEAEKQAEANRLQAERIENERLEAIRIKQELAAKEQELVKEREANAEKERLRVEAENKAKKNLEVLNRRFEQMILKEISALGFAACDNGIENKELGWFIGSRHYDGFNTETEAIEWFKEMKERVRIMTEHAENAKKQADKQLQLDAELAAQKLATMALAEELQAKKDNEQKELESKRLAQLAPDKDKINALYLSLKSLAIPDFISVECQVIGTQVLNKISHILSYIKDESKKLN